MKTDKSICILSCLLGMDDSHALFYAEEISALGYPLQLICPGVVPASLAGANVKQIQLPLPTHHFEYGSNVFNLLAGLWERYRNSVIAYRMLLKMKPDILFCSQPDSWMVAIKAKRVLHNKVVVDLKEIYEDRSSAFPKGLQPQVRKMIRGQLERLAIDTDEIIHVSKARQDHFSYLGKPGIVISIFPDLAEIQPAAMKEHRGTINIIHAGGLRWSYASEQYLEAISMLSKEYPQTHFIVIGAQRSKLKNAALLDELIAQGVVEAIEYLPHAEVMEMMQKCDIGVNLVLPIDQTHILAMPRKLFEYLAAGIPVVAADVPTIREVVEGSQCGLLVDPESAESIAEGIRSLLDDPLLRHIMGENGRSAAELYYNKEAESRKITSLLERLS
jgi:glycosyltransferase involved in cell wall biosynthesis